MKQARKASKPRKPKDRVLWLRQTLKATDDLLANLQADDYATGLVAALMGRQRYDEMIAELQRWRAWVAEQLKPHEVISMIKTVTKPNGEKVAGIFVWSRRNRSTMSVMTRTVLLQDASRLVLEDSAIGKDRTLVAELRDEIDRLRADNAHWQTIASQGIADEHAVRSENVRLKAQIERLTARLKEAGEAMLNWHLLDDGERDTATNRALEESR